MQTIYTDDVTDLESLTSWLEQQNESSLKEYLDFYHDVRKGRVVVRFPEGDLLNGPSRLASAVKGTEMEFDHISVSNPAVIITSPE